jgi:hypothetical protein
LFGIKYARAGYQPVQASTSLSLFFSFESRDFAVQRFWGNFYLRLETCVRMSASDCQDATDEL